MAGATLRSQVSPRFPYVPIRAPRAYACILLPLSNHYSLSRTVGPPATRRVIDHSRDGPVARHPACGAGIAA